MVPFSHPLNIALNPSDTQIHTYVIVLELVFAVKASSEGDSSLPVDDLVETLHIAPWIIWSIGTKFHTDGFSSSYCTTDSSNSMKLHNTVFFLTVSTPYNIHILKQTFMMGQILFKTLFLFKCLNQNQLVILTRR